MSLPEGRSCTKPLLDRILENTSFTEALPLEEPSSHEEAPLIESAILTLNHLDSTKEPSPKPKTMEEEDQPLEFPFEFEDNCWWRVSPGWTNTTTVGDTHGTKVYRTQ